MQLPINYETAHPSVRKKAREAYVIQQKGMCYWCDEPLTGKPAKSVRNLTVNWSLFPPHFLKHPVHLQHCHDTGMTEGAVHALCNAVMWDHFGR
jgi:hypothetical protein